MLHICTIKARVLSLFFFPVLKTHSADLQTQLIYEMDEQINQQIISEIIRAATEMIEHTVK